MKFLYTTSKNEYQKFEVGAFAHVIIFNDSTSNYLQFSLTGASQDGVVLPNEGIEFRDANLNTIYINSLNTGSHAPFRLWAYGKRNLLYSQQQQAQSDFSPKLLELQNFSQIKRVFSK